MKPVIILTVFIIALVTSYFLVGYKERLDARPRIDIVISRYAETLEWLYDTDILASISREDTITNLYIYNKGKDDLVISKLPKYVNVKIIKVENVGRCDHTYLFHIKNHYAHLADVTIFLPGSSDMDSKFARTKFVIKRAYNDRDTVMVCAKTQNVRQEFDDFYLNSWMSSNTANATANKKDEMLQCEDRPFGKWYDKVFGPDLVVTGVTWNGIFAASNRLIWQRPVSFYEHLISYVDKHNNPEAGHYIERAWLAIFHPVPDERRFYDLRSV